MTKKKTTRTTKRKTAGMKAQRITRRIVNTKRHTTGYVVGGQNRTVPQVRNLAAQGQVAGVRVVGQHIQSTKGRKNLLSLPVTLEK